MALDKERFERQKLMFKDMNRGGVNEFGKLLPGRSTGIAPTGFGKTMIAQIARRVYPDASITVIVPTTALKDQWIRKEIDNCKVITVQYLGYHNSFKELETDILIIDEIHRFASDIFYKVFKIPSRLKTFGLTATIDRLDGKEELIKQHAPVAHTVTYEEAVKHGWVEDVKEVNLRVPLTDEENEEMQRYDKLIKFSGGFFSGYDIYGKDIYKYCRFSGFVKGLEQMSGVPAKEITRKANLWRTQIHKREQLLHAAPSKVAVAIQLGKLYEDEYKIYFGKSVSAANEIKEALGDRAIEYHSEMKSRMLPIKKIKDYKTMAGAMNAIQKTKGAKYELHNGKHCMVISKIEKVGPTRLKKMGIALIEDLNKPHNTIVSAKALEVGLDVQILNMGIIVGRDSNFTSYIQIRGRIGRKITDSKFDGVEKKPTLINLVSTFPDSDKLTQDQKWLQNAQPPNTPEVNSIEELQEFIDEGSETGVTVDNLMTE